MKRSRKEALELRRKKLALLAFWNRLAGELRGSEAQENVRNLQTAGRLLEACQDRQGVFETRARKFLGESWRTYRRISDLLKSWNEVGDLTESRATLPAKLSEPCGVNYQGYWKPPPGWNDPKNVSHEVLRAWARKMASRSSHSHALAGELPPPTSAASSHRV